MTATLRDPFEVIATVDQNGYSVYTQQVCELIAEKYPSSDIKELLYLTDATLVNAIHVCVSQDLVERWDDGSLTLTETAKNLLSFGGAHLQPITSQQQPINQYIDMTAENDNNKPSIGAMVQAMQDEFANDLAFDIDFTRPHNAYLIRWEKREKMTASGRQRLAELCLSLEGIDKEIKIWLNMSTLSDARKLQKLMTVIANDVRAQQQQGKHPIADNRFRVTLTQSTGGNIYVSDINDYREEAK